MADKLLIDICGLILQSLCSLLSVAFRLLFFSSLRVDELGARHELTVNERAAENVEET